MLSSRSLSLSPGTLRFRPEGVDKRGEVYEGFPALMACDSQDSGSNQPGKLLVFGRVEGWEKQPGCGSPVHRSWRPCAPHLEIFPSQGCSLSSKAKPHAVRSPGNEILPLEGFPNGSNGKVSARNAEELGLIPGSGQFPGEGNGNPLQYPCLENPMDGGAW